MALDQVDLDLYPHNTVGRHRAIDWSGNGDQSRSKVELVVMLIIIITRVLLLLIVPYNNHFNSNLNSNSHIMGIRHPPTALP